MVVFGRSGDDLLSRVLRHSTIGAEEFNGRVRDGIGFLAPRSNHRTGEGQGKGAGPHPELFKSSKVKGLSGGLNAPGPQGPASPTGRPRSCAEQPRERTLPPASEANFKLIHGPGSGRTWIMRVFKPIERLVPVSSTRCRAYTPGLSTWSSSTALKGYLVLRWVSRLDAFSGYPVRT